MLGLLVAVAVVASMLVGRSILPRLAHRAFERGAFPEARRWYRVIAWTSPWPRRRAAGRVSMAGALLAVGRWREGVAETAEIDGERLDAAVRAGWLNNRAYGALRLGGLLATGRVDDAIRAFELMWEHGELEPRLEAERAADLGRAWAARGETAYAADYARRARRAVPDAPWVAASDEVAPVDPALIE
jgi:hypothetical protein